MPAHHVPGGGFRNPWPVAVTEEPGPLAVVKWLWQRQREGRPPDPRPDQLQRATPDLVRPRVPADAVDLRITWIGHSSFLLQMPGANVLTDPMFSRRASPVQWAGPKRFTPPGLAAEDLPPIDAVVISHDHYDHLDRRSVAAIEERAPGSAVWLTPLGYRDWFGRCGVEKVVELDWWDEARVVGAPGTSIVARALPARHWTRRRLGDTRRRLWCSWAVEVAGRRVYFGGDSGYCPGFSQIGEREAPFDVALLPIGAYEPRWFMRSSHMNPEEAAQAARDVKASAMVGMHWGTFRLTDENPLEPPGRARQAWGALGLPAPDLHLPAHGETVTL